MSNMGIIIKEYGKVQINERQELEIVKARNHGKTSLRKVYPRKPYTQPLSKGELTTVKMELGLN